MRIKLSTSTSPIMIHCFCSADPESGNLAGVIIDFQGSDDAKLALAAEFNFPVTVFLTDVDSEVPLIEFYYPQRKMPLCLHGALAAAKVILNKRGGDSLEFVTGEGEKLSVKENGRDCLQVKVSAKETPVLKLNREEIAGMLRIDVSAITLNLPFTVASVGSPKLLVPVVSSVILESLSPDYDAITVWSIASEINGMYVYVRDAESSDFIARGFNPKTGHNEDAATGVAAGALALVLRSSISVVQGSSIDGVCKIVSEYLSPKDIWVGGMMR